MNWPVTWAECAACGGAGPAGIQVLAVSRRPVQLLQCQGRTVGSVFEDGDSRHCLLGGLGASHPEMSRPEQTHRTLLQLESLLKGSGFAFGDITRTWFYLQDILAWYGDFNKVRTAFYDKQKFRIGSTPASTGVSGNNPAGSALAASAWAMQPLRDSFRVREVLSPLQCPAPSYGSSFSRAVEFSTSYGRRLLVSGTASIEPGGKTLWAGELRRQVNLTMEVVGAILKSRQMGYDDCTRATVYFKEPQFVAAFNDWCAGHAVRSLPSVLVHCDICRDDLLFEIELDAAANHGDYLHKIKET